MSEPPVTTTLAAWLETVGPKRCIMWIAETCDEIAVRDVPEWKFWLEMGSLLRGVAAALPAYNDTTATDGITRQPPPVDHNLPMFDIVVSAANAARPKR